MVLNTISFALQFFPYLKWTKKKFFWCLFMVNFDDFHLISFNPIQSNSIEFNPILYESWRLLLVLCSEFLWIDQRSLTSLLQASWDHMNLLNHFLKTRKSNLKTTTKMNLEIMCKLTLWFIPLMKYSFYWSNSKLIWLLDVWK